MTNVTSPVSIRSTTFGEPSAILWIVSQGTPMPRIACAVPEVATTRKPAS
jgi:hypothetical protein